MDYKKFEIQLAIQILLIIASSLLISFSLQKDNLQFATIYFIIILIAQAIILYNYLHRKNQKIIDYIKNITQHDTDDKLLKTSFNLSDQFLKNISNTLSSQYQKLEQEKQFHKFYLSYVLESVNVGIIAMNNNTIEFHNSHIKSLFKIENEIISKTEQLDSSLYNILKKVKLNSPIIQSFNIKGEVIPLSIHLTHFKLDEKEIKLYTFYNVKSELQENEIKTWQEVIRVISHEIMNSISPIKSLSSTMVETLVEELKNDNISKNQVINILEGIEAIEKRSISLSDFVKNYKQLTKIPKPVMKEFNIIDLFVRIEKLFQTEIQKQEIQFSIKTEPEDIILIADENLLEQIIINIITNSIQALEKIEKKKLEIGAIKEQSKVLISITDNGKGISEDEMDKVFLPFFTTKKQGSGIGLSLAQQVMKLHKGNISVQSIPYKKTNFTLSF